MLHNLVHPRNAMRKNSPRHLLLLVVLCLLLSFSCAATETRSSNTNGKLIALFHPGPGKTGTTHLQSFLMKTEQLLQVHNYAVWPNLYPAFQECKKDGSLLPSERMLERREKQLHIYYKYFDRCLPIQNTIRKFIQNSAKLRHHVIFSSETFLASKDCVKNIMDMLTTENFQIHGVISYRFPLSWFISYYNQEIAFNSITSRENNPKQQLSAPLFSEFLQSTWNHVLTVHKIKIFMDILSSYPDFRLSIIDLYGTVAAQKDVTYVFLCEIAGIMCDNPIFEELKSLHSHFSEKKSVIIERQMGFIFANFASMHNCTFSFSEKGSESRIYLRRILQRHKWTGRIPQQSVNISEYAQLSLEMDRNLRSDYGKYFINGNAEANALQVTPLPVMMEVDRVVVSSHVQWLDQMTHHLTVAKKKGLCLPTLA